MTDQPEALFLADVIENDPRSKAHHDAAAACLRRLHAEIERLRVGRDEWENEALRMRPHQQRLLNRAEKAEAECDALRAEVARLTTWQPMETAPMDGTIVLLAYKNALGKLRRVRASYMTRDLIGEYEDDEIERNPGWYERSEAHEEVTETVYPVSYELLCWTPLPALKEST